MSASPLRPPGSQPSQLLPWSLAGVSAIALGVVAVTAWRAADSQRRDGEAALLQAAGEVAALKAGELKRKIEDLQQQTKSGQGDHPPIHLTWFTQAGAPDDWIFGPWPQPENPTAKSLTDALRLTREGKSGEAGQVFSVEASLLRNPKLTTSSGLPLGPLAAHGLMETDPAHVRQRALDLIESALALPSALTTRLVESAASRLMENAGPAELQKIAASRAAAFHLDQLRTVLVNHRREVLSGAPWLGSRAASPEDKEAERWHISRIPETDELLVLPLAKLGALARDTGIGQDGVPGLPGDWVLHASLDGWETQRYVHSPGSVRASAAAGPWLVEAVYPVDSANETPKPEDIFVKLDAQLFRQRSLIAGATLFIGSALGGFLLVLGRQRRLNAMMSNFVASVSHELRAPLGSIGLLAERLGTGHVTDPEEQRQYHQLIRGECRRLSGTIENVLSFSRLERGQVAQEQELSNLTALVKETAELLRPLAEERHVTLTVRLPETPLECEIDPTAIRQAVLNLLDNALKFSPGGGTIRLGLAEEGDHAVITVSDEGPGVPEAEHGRIFDAFYRIGNELRRETPGIGIGLAIVRQAALAHGGSVSVKNRTETTRQDDGTSGTGSGTVFELRLRIGPALVGTSDIGHRTSDIGHRTSDIGHRTSDIEHRTSNIEHRTSDIGHRTSDIE